MFFFGDNVLVLYLDFKFEKKKNKKVNIGCFFVLEENFYRKIKGIYNNVCYKWMD